MIHTILITVHAAAGVVAFVAGCFAVRRSALFPLYFGALAVSVGSLVAAVAEEWMRIDTVSHLVFSGLIVLAVAMVARADRARRLDPGRGTDVALARYQHLAFTLISLFAAYVVIQVRGLGAPLWAVLGSVAVSSLAGHFVSRWFEGRALRPVTRATARTAA